MVWKLEERHNPPYSVFDGTIKQLGNDHDQRQLRLIRLHNGMQMLVVHSAAGGMAAMSMTISVGDLHDPEDLPGLAHFLEHMWTHESVRYPEEHSFRTYLSKCGGTSSAWTEPDAATYNITVENDALAGALDRFASQLYQPLFSARAISQEVRCIESEFQNYLFDDSWRLYDLDRHLSKAGDTWRHFGVGNWSTLARTEFKNNVEDDGDQEWISDLRVRLCKWHSEYYNATRMHMVIIGTDSLDKLTAMGVSHFSSIPHHLRAPLPPSPIFDSPWSAEQEGTVVLAKTVKDKQQIEVRWVVPTQTLLYRVKPLEFLSYFLHRKGSGSLHDVLASRGWITSLYASRFGGNIERGFQFFYVHIYATATGWRAWETIVAMVHKYIVLVQDLVGSDPEFAASVHKEICSLSELTYRFRPPSNVMDEAKLLSAALSKSYPPEDVVTGCHIIEEWDTSVVSENLAFLTPHKARVTLSGRDGWKDIVLRDEPAQGDLAWDQAPWYNTEHRVLRLVHENQLAYTLEDAAVEGLRLRRGRSYFPENLDVLGRKAQEFKSHIYPRKIYDTPQAELWYKLDDQFEVPKTSVIIKMATTVGGASTRHRLFTYILNNLINNALADDFNDAAFGLLNCRIHCRSDGIISEIYGFSDKVPIILEIVVTKLVNLMVTPENLRIALEEVRKELENGSLAAPVDAAEELLDYLLSERAWTASEMLAELDAVDPPSIQRHLADILDRVHILVLVNGNTKEEDAINILRIIEEPFSSPLSASERVSNFRRDLLLPEGCNIVHEVPVHNPEEANCGLAFCVQVGDEMSVQLRATLAVLLRLIGTPMLNQLQVVDKLGYRVNVAKHSTRNTLSMRVKIQGTHNPVYLEQRVETSLGQMRRHLEHLTEEDLKNAKTSTLKRLRAKATDIEKEAYRFWDCIASGFADFTRREEEAAAVESLTMDDLLGFFDRYISPGSPTRRKLSVWFKSAKCCPPGDKSSMLDSMTFVEDIYCFKRSLLPSPVPPGIVVE